MFRNKPNIFTVQTSIHMDSKECPRQNPLKGKLDRRLNQSKVNVCKRKEPHVRSKWLSMLKIGFGRANFGGFYGLLATIVTILASFSVALLPTNNVLVHPQYWYEVIFSTILWFLYKAICTATEVKAMQIPFNKSILGVIVDLFTFAKATEVAAYFFIHLVWSEIYGYFEPFPHRFPAATYLSLIVIYLRLWTLIPKLTRLDPTDRARCQAHLWRLSWGSFVTLQLVGLLATIRKIPLDFQWMFALIVPITKEINDRVIDALVTKSGLG